MHPDPTRSRVRAALAVLAALVALWTAGTAALVALSDVPAAVAPPAGRPS